MDLKITVDIFSGRANPTLQLRGKEVAEALTRLRPVRKLKKGEMRLPPASTLGYRGLLIEQVGKPVKGLPRIFRFAHGDIFAPRFAARAADDSFEDFVCGSTGLIRKLKLGREFSNMLQTEISRYLKLRVKWPWDGKFVWPLINSCRCAPLYEPDWWNDASLVQYNNNCYNVSVRRTASLASRANGDKRGRWVGEVRRRTVSRALWPTCVA